MKKQLLLLLFSSACISTTALAQTDTAAVEKPQTNWNKYWKYYFDGGINANQAYFSDSWRGGGENSLALGAYIFANIRFQKNNWYWGTYLNTQYGMMKYFKPGTKLRKTTDMFQLSTKAEYKFAKSWRAFASARFETQYQPGYTFRTVTPADPNEKPYEVIDSKLSNFMAPGYTYQDLGIEFKPVEYFYVNLGLVSLRQTYVMDTTIALSDNNSDGIPDRYGVDMGKRFRNQFGFSGEMAFDKNLHKNINLKFKYRFFKDYDFVSPFNMVQRFDVIFSAKITKFISTNLTYTMLFDRDQDVRVQHAQGLTVGFKYVVGTKE